MEYKITINLDAPAELGGHFISFISQNIAVKYVLNPYFRSPIQKLYFLDHGKRYSVYIEVERNDTDYVVDLFFEEDQYQPEQFQIAKDFLVDMFVISMMESDNKVNVIRDMSFSRKAILASMNKLRSIPIITQ